MTELQVLRKARGLIDSPGKWTKGSLLRGEDGSLCLLGAIRAAQGSKVSEFGPYERPKRVMHVSLDLPLCRLPCHCHGYHAVYEFNDHKDTTHADVLAVIDARIAQLEGR